MTDALKRSVADDMTLAGEVGITTSSIDRHVSVEPEQGKVTLFDLPRIMRDELDMQVLDVNTRTLASFDPAHLDRFRQAAEDAGCVLTNLKLNQKGLDMSSPDEAVRTQALDEYKRSIDAAAHLGMRWARPLPLAPAPDMDRHVAAWRELADYAAERGIRMIIENYGWMTSDPQSVVRLIHAVDRNLAASPDTGSWDDNVIREQGLRATFPFAVTCDYKARDLGPDGEHAEYDLKQCFDIGWDAGFRGPWCIEHANDDLQALYRELRMVRDMVRRWCADRS